MPVPDDTITEALERWLGTKSRRTADAYRRDLRRIAQWSGDRDAVRLLAILASRPQELTARLASRYQYLAHGQLAPKTVWRQLGTLERALRAMTAAGIVGWKADFAPPPPTPYQDLRPPAREDILHVLRALRDLNTPRALRQAAQIALVYDAGLVSSEVALSAFTEKRGGLDRDGLEIRKVAGDEAVQ